MMIWMSNLLDKWQFTVPIATGQWGLAMTTLVWMGKERSVRVVGQNPILTEVIWMDGLGRASNVYRHPTLPKCQGCLEDQPNQMAHIGPNGCLGEELY
jgi:hypothetical protein